MELGENIRDSISYPFSNFTNLIILGVLLLFSFLIIPIPFIVGYIYKVTCETLEGNDELPAFEDLGDLFINGLKLIVVFFIYGLVLGIISLILNSIGIASGSNAVILLCSLITGIIGLIYGLFVIAVPINMAMNNGEFGAAFDFSTIKEMITSIGIVDYIIWYIVVAIIGTVVTFISYLLIITIIGIIITVLGLAWVGLFEARSTALLFGFE